MLLKFRHSGVGQNLAELNDRESSSNGLKLKLAWIPAFAGMTSWNFWSFIMDHAFSYLSTSGFLGIPIDKAANKPYAIAGILPLQARNKIYHRGTEKTEKHLI